MRTKEAIKYYLKSKRKITVMEEELRVLQRRIDLTNDSEKMAEKQRLEVQISQNEAFLNKVDFTMGVLKADFEEEVYELFYLKHFKSKTLEYLALEFNYGSTTSVWRRIKTLELEFEELMNH